MYWVRCPCPQFQGHTCPPHVSPSPPSPQGHHRDCQSPPPTPRGHNPALLTCNDLILGAPFLPRLDNLLPWYSQPQPRRPLPAPSPQGAPGPMFGWAPGGLGSLWFVLSKGCSSCRAKSQEAPRGSSDPATWGPFPSRCPRPGWLRAWQLRSPPFPRVWVLVWAGWGEEAILAALLGIHTNSCVGWVGMLLSFCLITNCLFWTIGWVAWHYPTFSQGMISRLQNSNFSIIAQLPSPDCFQIPHCYRPSCLNILPFCTNSFIASGK